MSVNKHSITVSIILAEGQTFNLRLSYIFANVPMFVNIRSARGGYLEMNAVNVSRRLKVKYFVKYLSITFLHSIANNFTIHVNYNREHALLYLSSSASKRA